MSTNKKRPQFGRTGGANVLEQKNYTTLPGIASGLSKVRWHGDYNISACCPAHDDRNPSLSVSDKNGKILVHCWAGCSQEEVIGALRDLGLWHSASRHHIDRRKRNELKEDIRHHQQMLLVAAALTIDLSQADIAKVKESMAFLKEHLHE